MRRDVEPENHNVPLVVAALVCLKLEKQPLKRSGGSGRSYKGRKWDDLIWPTLSSADRADMEVWNAYIITRHVSQISHE